MPCWDSRELRHETPTRWNLNYVTVHSWQLMRRCHQIWLTAHTYQHQKRLRPQPDSNRGRGVLISTWATQAVSLVCKIPSKSRITASQDVRDSNGIGWKVNGKWISTDKSQQIPSPINPNYLFRPRKRILVSDHCHLNCSRFQLTTAKFFFIAKTFGTVPISGSTFYTDAIFN